MAETSLSAKPSLALVILALFVCFPLTRMLNEDDVARVEEALENLERERDSIEAAVAANVAVQRSLRQTRESREAEVGALHWRWRSVRTLKLTHRFNRSAVHRK